MPKKVAAAVAWPLGNPIEASSGRVRAMRTFKRCSAAGAASIAAAQIHQRALTWGNTMNNRSAPGRSTCQLPR